jgi:hypothetical protein
MILPHDWMDELQGLLDRLQDGGFTAADGARLNELIHAGPEPRDFLIGYLEIGGALTWNGRLGSPGEPASADRPPPGAGDPAEAHSPAPTAIGPPGAESTAASPAWGAQWWSCLPAYAIPAAVFGLLLLVALLFSGNRATELAGRRRAPGDGQGRSAGGARSAGHAAEIQIGREGITADSGSAQLDNGPGLRVSLLGPYRVGLLLEDSMVMLYGRSTVRVETGRKFTLRMPEMALTCRGGEFGVELDRSGDGWIQVFSGGATLWLHDILAAKLSPANGPGKIMLGENESVRIRQYENGCTAMVTRDVALAASLASRLPSRIGPSGAASRPQPGFLQGNLAGTSPGETATGASVPPEDAGAMLELVSMPTAKISPETDGWACTTFGGGLRFPRLVPGKSDLHLRFITNGLTVYAIRLNGKKVPFPDQPVEGAARQAGAVVIRDGFRGGNEINDFEFDVRTRDAQRLLRRAPARGGDRPLVVTVEVWPRR